MSAQELEQKRDTLKGEIVGLKGTVTAVESEAYVVDGKVRTGIKDISWPLRKGDKVRIQGYLGHDPSRNPSLELKHSYLADHPLRTPRDIAAAPGSYYSAIGVTVRGRLTRHQGGFFYLDDQLVVPEEEFDRGLMREPVKIGDLVTVRGDVRKPKGASPLVRLESATVQPPWARPAEN